MEDKRSFCGPNPLLASCAHTAKKKKIIVTIQFFVFSVIKILTGYFSVERVSVVY